MGTRARVNVLNGNQTVVSIYRQWDGYPDGLGQELADFSKKFTIINGIGIGDENGDKANGMGCFGAQLVKHMKDGIGNVYLRDISDESQGEEFSYNLSEKKGKVWMAVYEGHMTAFGLPGDKPSEMKHLWSGYAKDFSKKFTDETVDQ